jgi:hypothetical protein
MKRIAIIQSNYIPWKGYFDIINSVDEFVFHDDLQFTKNDWRNRNKIKTEKGATWLTIPCGTNERRLICEVELKDNSWQKKHWNQIERYYSKAKYWGIYKDFFYEVYLNNKWNNLSEFNQTLVKKISKELLGVFTIFRDSREFSLKSSKAERVLELLKEIGATSYLSGPSAKNYLKESMFKEVNIDLCWMDYSGYPEYNQLFKPFIHEVSIIDLIFNEGPESRNYLKSFCKSLPVKSLSYT